MEISCNVIRDLLPLYAEDMVSEDSKKIIETHVCNCAGCSGILAGIREEATVPAETEIQGMERVEENIRKHKSLSVATAVLLTVTILVSLFVYLTVPVWLSAEEAIDSFIPMDDGRMKIQFTDAYTSRLEWGNYLDYKVLLCYTVRISSFIPQSLSHESVDRNYWIEGLAYEDDALTGIPANYDWWYMDYYNGKPGVLLYDAAKHAVTPDEIELYGHFKNQTPVLVGAFVGAVLFGILALMTRKYWVSHYLSYAGWLFGCYGAAMLVVTSGRMLLLGEMMLHLLYIPFLAVLYFATGIVAFKLWQTRTHE